MSTRSSCRSIGPQAFAAAILPDVPRYPSQIGGKGCSFVGRAILDHPLRTLLYELFLEPFLRLLQQPSGGKVNAPPTKNGVRAAA